MSLPTIMTTVDAVEPKRPPTPIECFFLFLDHLLLTLFIHGVVILELALELGIPYDSESPPPQEAFACPGPSLAQVFASCPP